MKFRGHVEITNDLDLSGGQRFNDNTPESGSTPVRGFIKGGRVNFIDTSSVSIGTTGESSVVSDFYGDFSISWGGEFYINIANSGANGLDTGSESSNTWYAIHVIGDSSAANNPAGLLSTSEKNPTLPTGWNIFRRLGWVRNNGSSNFLEFRQYHDSNDRVYIYDESKATLAVLSGGTATSDTTVDLSSFVPPNSNRGYVRSEFTHDAALDVADVVPDDWNTSASLDRPYANTDSDSTGNSIGLFRATELQITDSSQDVSYKVTTGDSLDITVFGFWDEI